MRVYVVSTGEKDEGHTPVSVHATFTSARLAVEKIAPGRQLQLAGHGAYRAVVDGRDEVWVNRFVVRGEVAA